MNASEILGMKKAEIECERVAKELDSQILATPTSAERNELTAAAIAARECAVRISKLK